MSVDERLRELETRVNGVSLGASCEPEWDDVYPWPHLDAHAMYGLPGEIVAAVAPHTEADPAAMLLTLLVAFGNAVGPAPYAAVMDDRHCARLFAALVGATSTGGKGTSAAAIRPFLRAMDEDWLRAASMNGFVSGEAIIAHLAGEHCGPDEVNDKRAFIVEPEFARLLTVNSRDNSTSSQILRGAWDDGRLQIIRARASHIVHDAHVSILAHITPDELRSKLSSTEVAAGFANRFLFACVKRVRKLPSGGSVPPSTVGPLAESLRLALANAQKLCEIRRTDAAEALWAQLYEAEAERDGIIGEITARAHAQKLRLSVVYALLDLAKAIEPKHVIAAEALWRYCVASVEWIFGGLRGDGVQDRILDCLRASYPEGQDATSLRDMFSHSMRGSRIDSAIRVLLERDLISAERDENTGGRPRTVYFARTRQERDITGPKPGGEELASLLSRFSVFGSQVKP